MGLGSLSWRRVAPSKPQCCGKGHLGSAGLSFYLPGGHLPWGPCSERWRSRCLGLCCGLRPAHTEALGAGTLWAWHLPFACTLVPTAGQSLQLPSVSKGVLEEGRPQARRWKSELSALHGKGTPGGSRGRKEGALPTMTWLGSWSPAPWAPMSSDSKATELSLLCKVVGPEGSHLLRGPSASLWSQDALTSDSNAIGRSHSTHQGAKQ